MLVNKQKIITLAQSVLSIEAQAILELSQRIDEDFIQGCQLILNCEGRVVVTGMGKSGHIARKITATMASTGTPTFFLHPAEASHGDLGMLTQKDVVLLLSNSGETEEILRIFPLIKRLGVPVIALTGRPGSSLANLANIHLDVSVHQEACPLGLAPTASTTAALAMGDALALAVLEARGFTAEDFAKSHPAGRLGKRLLIRIEDIMRRDEAIPRVAEGVLLSQALIEMTEKRLGFTIIVSRQDDRHLLGIFTDGDLRRVIEKGLNFHETPVQTVMTRNCKYITIGTLASEAIRIMVSLPKSFAMPVLDLEGKLVGAFNMHDLLQAGVL